jgi:hypothetical protein
MAHDDKGKGQDRPAGDGINREGARRYDEGVREHARSGAPQHEAKDAARALDGPEGDELRDAEREGKAGAHKRS